MMIAYFEYRFDKKVNLCIFASECKYFLIEENTICPSESNLKAEP